MGAGSVGFLIAWALARRDATTAAGVVAVITAVSVGGMTMFWGRKLITRRRITRLVYRRRLSNGE